MGNKLEYGWQALAQSHHFTWAQLIPDAHTHTHTVRFAGVQRKVSECKVLIRSTRKCFHRGNCARETGAKGVDGVWNEPNSEPNSK